MWRSTDGDEMELVYGAICDPPTEKDASTKKIDLQIRSILS